MRSPNGYRKLLEAHNKSAKRYSEIEDWDFITSDKPLISSRPLTLSQAGENESDSERSSRLLRQINRCIFACSLCNRGCKFAEIDNDQYDPHVNNDLTYSPIMIVKYEPNSSDIKKELFSEWDKPKSFWKDLYRTSIMKCYGNDHYSCPFIDMEVKSINPKLIICCDKKTSEYFKSSKIQCFHADNKESLNKIIKLLSNPQARNRLLS